MRPVTAALAIGVFLSAPSSMGADSARGRLVYETRCVECHAQSVHSRTKPVARSCEEIRAYVVRWTRQTPSVWTDADIDDVTLYLNERYYRFPVRDGRCVTPVAITR